MAGASVWECLAAAGGLAGFLVFAEPSSGTGVPTALDWIVAGCICGSVVVLAVYLALRGTRWWRATMFGAAGAVGFAFTASLTKAVGNYVATDWTQMFVHWQTYGMAVCGIISLFLAQNAFHAGPIAASQTTLVLVDPLASLAIGVGIFGDNLRTSGAYGPLEALSLLIIFVGAASLAHSPLVSGMKGDDERYQELLSPSIAVQAPCRGGGREGPAQQAHQRPPELIEQQGVGRTANRPGSCRRVRSRMVGLRPRRGDPVVPKTRPIR